LNEEEEKEIENPAKTESSEESEGKNIFKYKRDFSDEEESDEDRGHKRRKSSRHNSTEKESTFIS